MASTNRFRLLGIMMQHVDPDRATEKGMTVYKELEAAGSDLGLADMGIDSSAFVEIVAKMEQEFGVKIPPEEVVAWQSVENMLAALEK